MKATGIVRRIDDLGRVVIPREILRNLGLAVGDSLEICITEGCVCFVPHYEERDLQERLRKIVKDYEFDNIDNEKFQKAIKGIRKIIGELR